MGYRPNYNSTKVCFAYFGFLLGGTLRKKKHHFSFNDGFQSGQVQIARAGFAICRRHVCHYKDESFFSVAEHFAAERAAIDAREIFFHCWGEQ